MDDTSLRTENCCEKTKRGMESRVTVFVDDMRAPYRRMLMCHMIADDETELHKMANKIGVAQRWYQKDHYDICLSKRTLAVKYGAQEITKRQLGAMVLNRRTTGSLGNPTTAEDIAFARFASKKQHKRKRVRLS